MTEQKPKRTEVGYEFSSTVPFHRRGNDEACTGVGKQGTLKISNAVKLKRVIECPDCHTNLIPTTTPI